MKRKSEEECDTSEHISKKCKVEKEDPFPFDAQFFEEASRAWRSNKIERNDCTYEYRCTYCDPKSGSRCTRPLYQYMLEQKGKDSKEKINANLFCQMHIHKKYDPKKHLWQ